MLKNIITFLLFFTLFNSCKQENKIIIDGELKKWHRITLNFEGSETNELAEDNPFLNYRLDVTFKNKDNVFVIPGFYSADGNAAETSSATGNIWKVSFTPNAVGEWTYSVAFKKGKNIAVADRVDNAASAGFIDGQSGTFTVSESDKAGIDNRAKGRLQYVGESYLKFAESQKYFIKLGVDAPENLLAYSDFDVSTNALGFQKQWQPHAKDFEETATPFLWQEGKVKTF